MSRLLLLYRLRLLLLYRLRLLLLYRLRPSPDVPTCSCLNESDQQPAAASQTLTPQSNTLDLDGGSGGLLQQQRLLILQVNTQQTAAQRQRDMSSASPGTLWQLRAEILVSRGASADSLLRS
ncbi:unnamed protein product [Pleuronectes platessa]|uniref:Secreted protein n=1 Tax=Pleuronectes platessa TaxID=8262 RepID=A0A9N7UR52_PLEPL|nr:unnamed protein product [Pleuronectes platessa]